MIYPISKIRSDFPILKQKINGELLVYLDSAASAQKPSYVINCEKNFYQREYSSVHRGIHTLSSKATMRMEKIRSQIAKFINAKSENEIIFVKNSTEGINLVANSWGRYNLQPGDNIVITEMEHHANIVPWQMLSKEKQITVRYIPLLHDGTLDLTQLSKLFDQYTKLFAITQISNVLGTMNPIIELINQVHKLSNAVVLVDGAQGIVHNEVDVQKMNCDFYVFSGHKLYGPTGIGILYAKRKVLDHMLPWEGGGSMIRSVSLKQDTIFNDIPWKFEAGSPNIAGIIGLSAAINYIEYIGVKNIKKHESELFHYTMESLRKIPELIQYGSNNRRTGIVSFNLGQHHPYDIGSFLDQYGIAIRTGHHCAMPLMEYFHVSSMCRISIALYTDYSDIDKLVFGLTKIQKFLSIKS